MSQDWEDHMVIEYEDRMVMGAAFAQHHMLLHPFGCLSQDWKDRMVIENEDHMVMGAAFAQHLCCCTPWLHISGC